MPRRFQRARKPEEKAIRRHAILQAARRLMSKVGTSELSLSELARQSGVSKANIYRYFESREHVLLDVWIEEVRDLAAKLETAFSKVAAGDLHGTVAAVVASFANEPQLCELTSIVSPVIEQNVSGEAIASAKRTLVQLALQVGQLLHARLPAISPDDCVWAGGTAAIYVAGIWPAANPGPVAREVLAAPEFAGLRTVFQRDFTRFLEALFRGLMANSR